MSSSYGNTDGWLGGGSSGGGCGLTRGLRSLYFCVCGAVAEISVVGQGCPGL